MTHWWIAHQRMSKARFQERLAEGAQFYTLVTGLPLPTLDSVRAAMRSDGEVVSRA